MGIKTIVIKEKKYTKDNNTVITAILSNYPSSSPAYDPGSTDVGDPYGSHRDPGVPLLGTFDSLWYPWSAVLVGARIRSRSLVVPTAPTVIIANSLRHRLFFAPPKVRTVVHEESVVPWAPGGLSCLDHIHPQCLPVLAHTRLSRDQGDSIDVVTATVAPVAMDDDVAAGSDANENGSSHSSDCQIVSRQSSPK
ncbi:hypothetical protein ACLKA6_007321 [Drosophila palustris]